QALAVSRGAKARLTGAGAWAGAADTPTAMTSMIASKTLIPFLLWGAGPSRDPARSPEAGQTDPSAPAVPRARHRAPGDRRRSDGTGRRASGGSSRARPASR